MIEKMTQEALSRLNYARAANVAYEQKKMAEYFESLKPPAMTELCTSEASSVGALQNSERLFWLLEEQRTRMTMGIIDSFGGMRGVRITSEHKFEMADCKVVRPC